MLGVTRFVRLIPQSSRAVGMKCMCDSNRNVNTVSLWDYIFLRAVATSSSGKPCMNLPSKRQVL